MGFSTYPARAAGEMLDGDLFIVETADTPAATKTVQLSALKTALIARFAERVDDLAARAAADLNGSDKVVVAPNGSPAGEKTFTLTALLTWLMNEIEAGYFDDGLEVRIDGGVMPSARHLVALTPALSMVRAGGGLLAEIASDGVTAISQIRAANSGGAATSHFQKARGTLAALAGVSSGDQLGAIEFHGYDGVSAFRQGAIVRAHAIASSPSATDMESYIMFLASPAGSVTPTEVMRLRASAGLQLMGANTVIDANRHFRLRSYTVATLPGASTAGQMIYVSDGASNKRLAVSDGTNWRWPDGATVS